MKFIEENLPTKIVDNKIVEHTFSTHNSWFSYLFNGCAHSCVGIWECVVPASIIAFAQHQRLNSQQPAYLKSNEIPNKHHENFPISFHSIPDQMFLFSSYSTSAKFLFLQ